MEREGTCERERENERKTVSNIRTRRRREGREGGRGGKDAITVWEYVYSGEKDILTFIKLSRWENHSTVNTRKLGWSSLFVKIFAYEYSCMFSRYETKRGGILKYI